MINCDKRQKEVKQARDGTETEEYRCVESKALDTYLKIVDVPTCEGCPILALKQAKGCDGAKEPDWRNELLSVQTVGSEDSVVGIHMAEAQLGYEQPCHHRWDGKCRITGHTINPEICKACDQETADHMATLPEMAVGYANEVRRWIREGRPVRSDERVLEILKICKGDPESNDPEKRKPCELYNFDKESCNKCGCAMNDSSWPLRNGIKMATKICPLGRWR